MCCATFCLKQCFTKSTCLNGQQPIIICVYGLHLLLFVLWKCINSYHNGWKLGRNFDWSSVGRFYYQNKHHKNHTGYVYRKSVAAQDALWSSDLARRFSDFVYYRNHSRKEKFGWNKKRQEPPHEQLKQNAGRSSKAAVTPGISFFICYSPSTSLKASTALRTHSGQGHSGVPVPIPFSSLQMVAPHFS